MKKLLMLFLSFSIVAVAMAGVSCEVKAVEARQRYPWNGLVDIIVKIQCDADQRVNLECSFVATNTVTRAAVLVKNISQTGADSVSGYNTYTRHYIWNAAADVGTVKIDDLSLNVECSVGVQLWKDGPYWARCNIGATRPEACGYYFMWGDTVGYTYNDNTDGWSPVWMAFLPDNCPTYGKDISWLQSRGYIDYTGNLVATHDAATASLGAPWRMPTMEEFAALIENCNTQWTRQNGVYGRLVMGRGAYASKRIFLPAAGQGVGGALWDLGSRGHYWSSTSDSDVDDACDLYFAPSNFGCTYGGDRNRGRSVRPLRSFSK